MRPSRREVRLSKEMPSQRVFLRFSGFFHLLAYGVHGTEESSRGRRYSSFIASTRRQWPVSYELYARRRSLALIPSALSWTSPLAFLQQEENDRRHGRSRRYCRDESCVCTSLVTKIPMNLRFLYHTCTYISFQRNKFSI